MQSGYGGRGGYQSPYTQQRPTNGYNASPSGFAPTGGGGFMPSPSLDGQGGDTTNRRGKLLGDKQSLIPVTIKQLHSATQPHPDDLFKLDGRDLAQISLVAKILSVNAQSTNISFKVDDGTGTIDTRIWIDNDDTEAAIEKRAGWQTGAYVRIIGHLRSLIGEERSVVAFNIRKITDFNEITFHNIEVIQVHLYNTRGPSKAMNGASSQATHIKSERPSSVPFNGYGGASQNGYGNGVANSGNDCQSMVLDVFRNEPDTDTGVALTTVLQRLRGQWQENDIRNAVQFLSEEGHLYSTIDEVHYKYTAS